MQVNARGSALLSALFIMTLVAIAATAMSMRLQLDIYRTRLTITSNKLYLASQAVTFWAMDSLGEQDKRFMTSGAGGKLADFPKQLQSIYPDVLITGGLYDLQARFNLNNLQDKKFQPVFLRLLENSLTQSKATTRQLLVKATQHWVSPHQPEQGEDQFLAYYLQQKPQYLPGFQPMHSVSEFRLIRGVTAEIYQELLPNITTLPEKTTININTAPKILLRTLGNGLTESQVNELIEARGKKGIATLNETSLLLQKLGVPKTQITLESQYFLSIAVTATNDLSLTNYTIIKRTKNKTGISISIINESLNTI